ncbi:MAG: 23S rRNA (adenine(2503)-C(2))-methyltransferase RlmN [Treponema sp.]|nr:23S rRNA (adenine(2503)-C(2))-methyltransferase RlmN [Treponema sp.]
MEKSTLSGFSFEELTEILSPLPRYRSKQVFSWISRGVFSFDEMTDLPKDLRTELDKRFSLCSSKVSAHLKDPDGTEKIQLLLQDDSRIEAVLLSDNDGRKTACLSTQAGCPMGCVFCKTGTLKFKRNLTAAEIIEQLLYLRTLIGGETPGDDTKNRTGIKEKIAPPLSNIVFMGMGEPLLNLTELRRAISVITSSEGMRISPRRITVSTSGIAGGIRELADKGPKVRLALSLTTADEVLRERLMPAAASHPLARVKDALLAYQEKTGLRITLEVVLLGGINTRTEDVKALKKFIDRLDGVVNLIPWNPVEGLTFEGKPLRECGGQELSRFTGQLEKERIKYTLRYRKGKTIGGACGQLGACPV